MQFKSNISAKASEPFPCISTEIAGIKLPSCIMNAAGCLSSSNNQLDDLYLSSSGAIVTKSGTVKPRSGNPSPNLYIDNIGSINSKGLDNPGFDYYLRYFNLRFESKRLIQSIHPFTVDELQYMITTIDMTVNRKYLVEINVSCPNTKDDEKKLSVKHVIKCINKLKLNNVIPGIK